MKFKSGDRVELIIDDPIRYEITRKGWIGTVEADIYAYTSVFWDNWRKHSLVVRTEHLRLCNRTLNDKVKK